MKKTILFIAISLQISTTFAQSILKAKGQGQTYELINSVLAPNGDVIETPDCSHQSFGRHIDEVFDNELKAYVFRFYIHKTPDNDRCINFDRQRNEIKTYDASPDSLKALVGERVEYRWKFKLDAGFQASSSFTHLHQIKAVGGTEDDMPLITLTARKGTPDKLEIRFAEHLNQVTIHQVDLTPFKGNWVEVTEIITYGETGKYSIEIKKVSDQTSLLSYKNESIRMWKTEANFLRPKWGIYRSLNNIDDLRDEILFFNDFYIKELTPNTSINSLENEKSNLRFYPNPVSDYLYFANNQMDTFNEFTISTIEGKELFSDKISGQKFIDVSALEHGIYFIFFKKKNVLVGRNKIVKI